MNRFWKILLLTTLIVGITDLILAYSMQFAKTGKFADRMLYYLAGGALGLEKAMKGGFWIGLLGLVFHFIIAFSFTLLVFIVFPKLKMQRLNKSWLLLFGILYAPFVSCFMRYLVLPLTQLPADKPLDVQKELLGWFIFGIVFGIPIFLGASQYYKGHLNRTIINH